MTQNQAFPAIKCKPVFMERIWGSDRLRKFFGKDLPAGKPIGESWELSDLPQGQSIMENGPAAGRNFREFLDQYGQEFGFNKEQCTPPFGLLIKLLDASQVLSVQVHPDDAACRKYPGTKPKTECWYVLSAEPDAVIYKGLKKNILKDDVLQALQKGNLPDRMEVYKVRRGDFHYIPAGTIHALGAGVMVAEIQTPSDTTYRLYDWGRVDDQGMSRTLHIEKALDCIHYTYTPPTGTPPTGEKSENDKSFNGCRLQKITAQLGKTRLLLDCEYFSVTHLDIEDKEQREFTCAFPVVMMILSGMGTISSGKMRENPINYQAGDTLLLPAGGPMGLQPKTAGECLIACLGPVKAK